MIDGYNNSILINYIYIIYTPLLYWINRAVEILTSSTTAITKRKVEFIGLLVSF